MHTTCRPFVWLAASFSIFSLVAFADAARAQHSSHGSSVHGQHNTQHFNVHNAEHVHGATRNAHVTIRHAEHLAAHNPLNSHVRVEERGRVLNHGGGSGQLSYNQYWKAATRPNPPNPNQDYIRYWAKMQAWQEYQQRLK
jgi:hypothetical protein